MISADIQTVLPEIILASTRCGAFGCGLHQQRRMAPLLTGRRRAVRAVGLLDRRNGQGRNTRLTACSSTTALRASPRVVILLSAAAVLVMSQEYMQKRDLLRFEYPILVALSVVGMMVMVSAGDLMALYMGLELQSLALYVVASLRRDSLKSTEAGLKYFVLGALSSGLLLYGASLTYGFAGTTLFSGIMAASIGDSRLGLLFGVVFMIAGLRSKSLQHRSTCGHQTFTKARPHLSRHSLRRPQRLQRWPVRPRRA